MVKFKLKIKVDSRVKNISIQSIFLFASAIICATTFEFNYRVSFLISSALMLIILISWVGPHISMLRRTHFERLKHLIPYLLIALFVSLVGDYLGIWIDHPVGDDAFLHVGRVLFILKNFPDINWYPYWYLGFDTFKTYSPTYYFLLAIVHLVTGVNVQVLIVSFFFISMTLLGIAIYKFSLVLDLPRWVGVGLAIMLISSYYSWQWSIVGGAYLRNFSLPFFIFSSLKAYEYCRKINGFEVISWKEYLSTISLFTFSLLINLEPAFCTFISLVLIFLVIIKGFSQKIVTLLKIFLPIGGLASWFYLPCFDYILFEQNSALLNQMIFGTLDKVFIYYNPALLPLFIISIVFFAIIKLKFKPIVNREKYLLTAIFFFLSLYFFLFGWIPMPEKMYIMASYDYCHWLAPTSILFLMGVLSLLFDSFNSLKKHNTPFIKFYSNFLRPTIFVIFIFAVITIPFVSIPNLWTIDVNPDDPRTFVGSFRKDVDRIAGSFPRNYRLAALTRRLYAPHYYAYPDLELTGGRQRLGMPNDLYHDIFIHFVFMRFPGEDIKYYFEERYGYIPCVSNSYFSSMFWLDWFGARGVVIAPWESTETFMGYVNRPQYFKISKFGGTTYAEYPQASPIVASTKAPTVGVVSSNDDYLKLLYILGELNFNSQWFVPVKLDENSLSINSEVLRFLDVILVPPSVYQTYRGKLDQYASSGGHLVVIDFNYSDSSKVRLAELMDLDLKFYTYANPLPVNQSYELIPLVNTDEGLLAYRVKFGNGLVTRSAISIQELYNMETPAASLLLAKILAPDLPVSKVSPIPNTWYIHYRKGIVEAYINQTGNSEAILSYTLNMTTSYNQVNFATRLEEEINTSAVGFIQFELWNDGEVDNIVIALISSKNLNYLVYDLPASAWRGWMYFSIPLANFIKKPDVGLLESFDGIVITVVDKPPYPDSNVHTLKLRNLTLYKLEQEHTYEPLEGRWVKPNTFEIFVDNRTTRVLWKETYTNDWIVKTIPEFSGLKYYYAGPGVIYLYLPQNVEKITFIKPLSLSQQVGMVISTVTFLSLIISPLYKKLVSSKRQRIKI
jgi:hypothetical protein